MKKILSLLAVLMILSSCAKMEAHKGMDNSKWLDRKHMRSIK